MVGNAADENQVRQAAGKEKSKRVREVSDTLFLLQSREGRRFIWKYLSLCHVFESSYTGNQDTFFKEGERNIGLKLLRDVEDASPDALTQMMRESKETVE